MAATWTSGTDAAPLGRSDCGVYPVLSLAGPLLSVALGHADARSHRVDQLLGCDVADVPVGRRETRIPQRRLHDWERKAVAQCEAPRRPAPAGDRR